MLCPAMALIDSKNMTFTNLLYEATMEAFEGLGEETMRALVWQFGTKGVSFSPDSFDIQVVAKELRELMDDGAESLLEEIYQNVVCRLELLSTSLEYSDKDLSNRAGRLSAMQKLQTIFGGLWNEHERDTT